MNYWIAVDGQQYGPYPPEQFFDMQRNGQIPSHARVFDPQQDPHWVAAGEVRPPLAASAMAAPVGPPMGNAYPAPAPPASQVPPQSVATFAPAAAGKTNGAAVASLVLGILGLLLSFFMVGLPLALLGVILGIVALRSIGKAQRTSLPQSGKGMAIAGLVTGIIGLLIGAFVLFAISLPVFLNQRSNANDASVQAELRNAAVAEETYYMTKGSYTSDMAALQTAGYRPSANVTVTATVSAAGDYCLEGAAPNATTYRYDSSAGLLPGTC